MKLPSDAEIAAWIAAHGVTKCPPAIAYGVAVDVVIPPDPDAEKRVADAFRTRAKQKPGWGGYWARKQGARQTAAQNAKNGRARSQHTADRNARTKAEANRAEEPPHA